MKKALALLLLLAAVCAISAAAAQSVEIYREDDLFYIEVTLPSGARVSDSSGDESLFRTDLQYIAEGKPSVVISAAPDEPYTGLSLADLSQEDISLIVQSITVEMCEPQWDIQRTQEGYEYVVCNETATANDTCDTVMLVNGYFIIVHVFYEDNSELTEADMAIGPSIVESLRFIGNTNT
jgi:hypothetical protein